MESKITYAKYAFPAIDMGNYEYTDGDSMYDDDDIAYCNGILPDGRPFLAEYYHDSENGKDYLVVVIVADEMMDLEEQEFEHTKEAHRELLAHPCFDSVLQMELDSVEGVLSGTYYETEITKYLLQQGVIESGSLVCDCVYLAIDKDDNYIVVADYELPNADVSHLQMKRYQEV